MLIGAIEKIQNVGVFWPLHVTFSIIPKEKDKLRPELAYLQIEVEMNILGLWPTNCQGPSNSRSCQDDKSNCICILNGVV